MVQPMATPERSGAPRIGCVLMASGESRRFGRDKLLEPFAGRPLLLHSLERLRQLPFARLVVVTRNPLHMELCRPWADELIGHDEPWRSDTVRLGVARMAGLDGCLFCVADQPLLTLASLHELLDVFALNPQSIVRLYWQERAGNPILFPSAFFSELSMLPQDQGGSWLARKYAERLVAVQAGGPEELLDADTPEAFVALEKIFTIKKIVQT